MRSLVQPDARRAAPPFDSLCLFTFFWAVGILVHQGYHGQFNADWHDVLLIVAAVAALLRPSSLLRLAVMAAAAVVAVAVEMPDVYNHWLLVGLASATILVVMATSFRWQDSNVASSRAALYHALAPPLRLMLLGTYAFAFLAKLNPHFLSERVSCAAITYPRLARRLTILPLGRWTLTAAIWFTLAMEAVIPLALALRRTRMVAVFVALAFHAMMGLGAFYDFSAAAAGLLVLFLPDDTPARLVALAQRRAWIAWSAAVAVRIARTPLSLPLLVTMAYVLFGQIRQVETPFLFTMRLWLVFTTGAFAVFVLAWLDDGEMSPPGNGRLTFAGRLWLFTAFLVLLDIASPPFLFTLLAAALLTALVPPDAPGELIRGIASSAVLSRSADLLRALARGPLALPVALTAGYVLMSQARPRRWESPLYFVLLGLVAWASARLLFALFRASRNAPAESHLRLRQVTSLVGPLLIVLNGLSPYVGLKTEHSFTMFSNLMTEGDRWNHLLLPRSLKVFPLQDDLVEVIQSSDQRFREFAQRRTQLVWVHFQSLVSRYPHIRITYRRAGQRYHVPRVGDDPVLSMRPAWVVDKLMDFRPVPPGYVCRH